MHIVRTRALNAHAGRKKWPKEPTEAKTCLELAEQLLFLETTQKQALQEAFGRERNELLNKIATLQKHVTCTENQANKMAKCSEFKGHANELKPHTHAERANRSKPQKQGRNQKQHS